MTSAGSMRGARKEGPGQQVTVQEMLTRSGVPEASSMIFFLVVLVVATSIMVVVMQYSDVIRQLLLDLLRVSPTTTTTTTTTTTQAPSNETQMYVVLGIAALCTLSLLALCVWNAVKYTRMAVSATVERTRRFTGSVASGIQGVRSRVQSGTNAVREGFAAASGTVRQVGRFTEGFPSGFRLLGTPLELLFGVLYCASEIVFGVTLLNSLTSRTGAIENNLMGTFSKGLAMAITFMPVLAMLFLQRRRANAMSWLVLGLALILLYYATHRILELVRRKVRQRTNDENEIAREVQLQTYGLLYIGAVLALAAMVLLDLRVSYLTKTLIVLMSFFGLFLLMSVYTHDLVKDELN